MTNKHIKFIAEHYGLDAQLNQLQEECAELIQAVSKYRRGQGIQNLAEEITDVLIMIDQITYLLGISDETIGRIGNLKIARQISRIEGETTNDTRTT